MRDRLIELLDKTFNEQYERMRLISPQHTAEFLLANGVIVPPCKVGDTLYDITEYFEGVSSPEIYEFQATEMTIEKKKDGTYRFSYDSCYICPDMIGKTVFLTREEAEAKLKEGVQE